MVHYWDKCKKRFIVEPFDLIDLKDGTAKGIISTLMKAFEEANFPTCNLVAFCADTCNTMFGINNSVSVLLKQLFPHLLNIKCSCHSIHLCSNQACLELPKLVEEFVRGTCTHFNRSAKRRDIYKKFQKLFEVPEHVFLSPGQTRWLALEYAVSRVLEQIDPLLEYYKEENKKDPTVFYDLMIAAAEDPLTKVYLEFLVYALNLFNEFNTTFQSEVPQVHTLKQNLHELIRTCAKNFMEDSYVDECDPMQLDPFLEDQFLPLSDVYLGNKVSLKHLAD